MSSEEEDDDQLTCRLDLACGELLAAKAHEPILVHLFTQIPPGQWLQLKDLLPEDLREDVFVTWLRRPGEVDAGSQFVIFIHEDSGWSLTATYEVARLLRSESEQGARSP